MDNSIQNNQTFIDDLEGLGIDVNMGLKYCGDIEFYREVLGISLESYGERYADLKKYFSDNDYRNYTILVHSIKSGSANIGALELSDMARALEDAGKDADYKYIIDNHNDFMVRYQQLMEGLCGILKPKDKEAPATLRWQQDITVDHWEMELAKLDYYLQELEQDMALELVDEILICNIKPKERELMEAIKSKLHHFDVEGAKANVEALKGECGLL